VELGAKVADHHEELFARLRERRGCRFHAGRITGHRLLPSARIRLFRGLCSTSASPSASRTGGRATNSDVPGGVVSCQGLSLVPWPWAFGVFGAFDVVDIAGISDIGQSLRCARSG